VKVKYGSLWLATGGKEAAQNVQLNGTQVVDVQQLFRAAAVRPVGRGNKADTLAFSVRLAKGTLRLAERFLLSHLAHLPTDGQLEIVCGRDSDSETFYNHAALVSVERTQLGVSPSIRYTFTCGLFTTDGTSLPSLFDEIDGGAADSTYSGAALEG
jgi:hypothetical protein